MRLSALGDTDEKVMANLDAQSAGTSRGSSASRPTQLLDLAEEARPVAAEGVAMNHEHDKPASFHASRHLDPVAALACRGRASTTRSRALRRGRRCAA
jgi:hypothetical protein